MNLTSILQILVHPWQNISLIHRYGLKVYHCQVSLINKRIQIDAFYSLKANKSSGADEINFNVIKHCLGELCGPLKYLFDSSLQIGGISRPTENCYSIACI